MHDCLLVPEILDLILRNVPPEPVALTARRHLGSAATTCKFFSEVALNIVWHTQTSLMPLWKTIFKEELLDPIDTHPFYRTFEYHQPSTQELERLSFYAAKILRISYLPYPFHLDSQELRDLEVLIRISDAMKSESNPEPVIFPNLIHLEFIQPIHAVQCLDIFLRSPSVSLAFYWNDNPTLTVGLFRKIRQRARHLQELDLGAVDDKEKPQLCLDLSDMVRTMEDLRGLLCASRMLDDDALRHILTLPNLTRLQLANTELDLLRVTGKNEDGLLPSLRRLQMPVKSFMYVAELLDSFRPLRLRTLTLRVMSVTKAPSIFKFFTSIESNFASKTSLTQLHLKSAFSANKIDPGDVVGVLDGDVLQPLLSFPNMAELVIDIPMQFTLDAHQVKEMATSWPSLRRLQLGATIGWGQPQDTLPSVDALLYLLKGCKDLEHLSLPFNTATVAQKDLSTVSEEFVNKKITYLYVGDSKISPEDIEPLARLLHRVLPNVTGIGGKWMVVRNRSQAGSRAPDEVETQWKAVLDFLRRERDEKTRLKAQECMSTVNSKP